MTPLLQSIILRQFENFIHFFYREEYDREIIKAEDGGTLGVDWAYCTDTRTGRPSTGQKPILLMSPGMGGKIY